MIDHIAGLIIRNNTLLVLRKITEDNRKECILPGGKREGQETDKETLSRELKEELDVSILSMKYFNTYYDKAVFETGIDFKQTTYIVEVEGEIEVKNEIKEALWIDSNYRENGIVCNPTLEQQILPDLIKRAFMKNEKELEI